MTYKGSLCDLLNSLKRVAERQTLSKRSQPDSKILHEAALLYATECNRTITIAKRLIIIRNQAWLPAFMTHLGKLRQFRVFSSSEIMKGKSSVLKHGGLNEFHLLQWFSDGVNLGAAAERGDHDLLMMKGSGLERCAAQYSFKARESVLVVFFTFVSVFSSLAGWTEPAITRTIHGIVNFLNRYISNSWNTDEMEDEASSNRVHMRVLWDVCSNFLMIRAKELMQDSLQEETQIAGKRVRTLLSRSRVQHRPVEEHILDWCRDVLQEYICWTFEGFSDGISATQYNDALKEPMAP